VFDQVIYNLKCGCFFGPQCVA